MRNLVELAKRALVLLGTLLVVTANATPTPAVQLDTIGREFVSTGWTLGFEFRVAQPVVVGALGVYDSAMDGLGFGASVGLWEDVGVMPTVLASVQIPAGTSSAREGFFRFVDVKSVTLLPGHIYVVGAFFNVSEDGTGDLATSLDTGGGGTGFFDDRLTDVTDRSGDGGVFEMPISSDASQGGWLGANMLLEGDMSVPEPTTASLIALALFGAGVVRRRC